MTKQTHSTSKKPRPFTFDQIFSRVEETVDSGGSPRDEKMSVADAAFEEGRKWGQEETLAGRSAPQDAQLVKLSQQIAQSLSRTTEQMEAHQRQSIQLAYTIASKLAPALMARSPRGEIEALIEGCFTQHPSEPSLTILVAPSVAPDLSKNIKHLAKIHGYEGKITILADGALTGEAIRIDWTNGSIGHDMAKVGQDISRLIHTRLGIAPAQAEADETTSIEERVNEKPA